MQKRGLVSFIFFTLSSAGRASGAVGATSGVFRYFGTFAASTSSSFFLQVAIQSPTQTKRDNEDINEDKEEGTDNRDDDQEHGVAVAAPPGRGGQSHARAGIGHRGDTWRKHKGKERWIRLGRIPLTVQMLSGASPLHVAGDQDDVEHEEEEGDQGDDENDGAGELLLHFGIRRLLYENSWMYGRYTIKNMEKKELILAGSLLRTAAQRKKAALSSTGKLCSD